jgi:hypothetical protein
MISSPTSKGAQITNGAVFSTVTWHSSDEPGVVEIVVRFKLNAHEAGTQGAS